MQSIKYLQLLTEINMNKEERIKRIKEITDKKTEWKQQIPWKGSLEPMPVYDIPLDLLVYNKYNGRILSRTKSLENQKQKIDVESDSGKKIIEQLLWFSKEERNKKTQISIANFGQQKVGIITKDGIIIDGNRRAMLLNDIQNDGALSKRKLPKKYNYFKAVVLPITLEENPIEIEELETKFQMGEDEKLGYNATEKYLKAKEIYLRLTTSSQIKLSDLNDEAIKKIADWMGESNSEVRKYMSTMVLMDEYLNYLEYDGIYTQLDSREDQFLSLTKWLNTFYNTESKKGFDGYDDTDVDDLKIIAFDYLRIRNSYDGKKFRNLAEGNKDKHFFGDKDIWKNFSSKHYEILDKIPEEGEVDFNSNNLEKHLNARDNEFFTASKFGKNESEFIENLKENKTDVGHNKASDAPEKLVKNASRAFDAIKTGHSSFAKPDVQKLVEELGTKVISSLTAKSPSKVLNHILSLLESIDIDRIPVSEVDDVKSISKKISSYCYHNFDKGL